MASINTRLTALETAAANAKNGMIDVTFADGHKEFVDGGTAVALALDDNSDVVSFTARPGSGHRLLPDLLNDILTI